MELQKRGHVVRGTTRRPEQVSEIEAVGAEAVVADPDRLATLVPALDHVSVAVVLLGSARGDPTALAALHGPRLEALLIKLLDTTIRGVVYESAGSVSADLLAQGTATVSRLCSSSRIPHTFIAADRSAPEWLAGALDAVSGALEPPVS